VTGQLWEQLKRDELFKKLEAACKNLKDDLALRPIYHQLEHRSEAHSFISFLAYCLQVILRRRLRDLAPGLTPRSVLEKFGTTRICRPRMNARSC
jgi:transposase